MCELAGMTITEYRKSLGMTLEAFAAELRLKSKGHLSDMEQANRASPEVALAIEDHSGGRLDASALNPVIAAARARVTPVEQAA